MVVLASSTTEGTEMNDTKIRETGIKCGHCGNRHPNVSDVRDCSKNQAATGPVVLDRYWYDMRTTEERQQAETDEMGKLAAEITTLLREREVEPRYRQVLTDYLTTQLPTLHGFRTAVARLRAMPEKSAGVVDTDGMYRDAAGTIYKVQKAVHGSGMLYAKRLVVSDLTGDDEGAPARRVTFEYEPGAIKRLRPSDRMTLEDAKAFGALYGTCCVCGRTLTDEKSIEAGIGPVCAGKV